MNSVSNRVYVIAEMACSHDGSVELAKKIIDGAAKAKADAVQLQIWSLDHMMTPGHAAYPVCQKIEFKQSQWEELVNYTRLSYPQLQIYAFVYEHTSIEFAQKLKVDGYKLSSADLSNPLMLEKVAAAGKPINLSVGASTIEEIEAALNRIRKISSKVPVTLMYGLQSFPTTLQDVHLNYMKRLTEKFNLPLGYQDHCDAQSPTAFWVPALSVGMGISIMEKHMTHDRSLKGIDHESALNPDEFERFVVMIRELETAKGTAEDKDFSEAELKYRKFQKKSIVASRPLKQGEKLTAADLCFLRAAELGLAPDKLDQIQNKTLKRDINKYQVINKDDVS